MARNIVFEDENGTDLRTHINVNDYAVLVLKQHHDELVYVFEDEKEIDDLILELQIVKTELLSLK